jgi:hypothetical protein
VKAYKIIKSNDIGGRWLEIGGKMYSLVDSIQCVQGTDVGKRAYIVNGIIMVESDAQMASRLKKARVK